MDGEPQPAARSLPPAPGSPAPQSPENPESLEPTPAAEIFIVLIPGNSTEGQQDIAEWTGSRRLAWLRRLGPKAFGVGISVPPAQASQAGHPVTLGDRITVALVEKASDDLQSTHERTRMSKTDIVNRAVSLYEFLESELSDGAQLIIRRDDGEYLVELL